MVLLSIPDGRTRVPVKPAQAVKAAEEAAAQREAKVQAAAREAAASAEKAAAQPKENLKTANRKKKASADTARQEDTSVIDTPVSTKVNQGSALALSLSIPWMSTLHHFHSFVPGHLATCLVVERELELEIL